MKAQLTWKSCLKKVVASGFILFILTFICWTIAVAIENPSAFSAGGHANAWPYLFMGSVFTTVFLSLLNLIYLLPINNLKIRFLSPGGAAIIFFSISMLGGDSLTIPFFLGAGLINLLIGFYHYKRASSYKEKQVSSKQ